MRVEYCISVFQQDGNITTLKMVREGKEKREYIAAQVRDERQRNFKTSKDKRWRHPPIIPANQKIEAGELQV